MLHDESGVSELEDFRCFMFGDANARVDLVQSFEVRAPSSSLYIPCV